MIFLQKTASVSTAYRAPFTGTPSINEALSLLHASGTLPGKFAQSKQTHALTSQAQSVQTEQPRDNVLMTAYQWKTAEKYSLLGLSILFTVSSEYTAQRQQKTTDARKGTVSPRNENSFTLMSLDVALFLVVL